MKRLMLGALVIAALLPALGHAQQDQRRTATLAWAWDLDGEAADPDQVLTAANGVLTDSTDYFALITAQPDTCRLIDITVTDGDSSLSAGALTVAGLGCLGEAKSCSFTFAGGGSGVKTLTCTDGMGAYMASITALSTGVLTGEGGADTATVGYTSNSVNGWPMYGRVTGPDANGLLSVDPFGFYAVNLPITTTAALSTTVTSVSSNGAFNSVSVGDLLLIPLGGQVYERKVTAKASANSITVNKAITIPTAGVTFNLKRFFFSTNPNDLMLIPIGTYSTLLVNWSVDANANTGGVVTLLECTDSRSPDFPSTPWVQINTTTVATGGTQAATTESIDLTLLPYTYCRMGFRFGTGDTADVADEDINASIVLTRN